MNSFSQILKKYSSLKPIINSPNTNPHKVIKLIRTILKYFFFSKNCFHRSFISAATLKIIGIKVDFIIGVSLLESFKSHSWIELDGTPIFESFEIDSYKTIYRL